ncbi:protein-L-isoaspartate O-methyltransferase [Acidisphaera sp. L21]|uniref:protein-L-isoaspartate O-methyltransferase family protein n=1 Tax=Acidisphaera sp. L21 TaxID=1641851 RepID=UPI0020B10AA5|nr:protein-L-isoaspartate O-methyltransferase [Acidisphaera sp. L21]
MAAIPHLTRRAVLGAAAATAIAPGAFVPRALAAGTPGWTRDAFMEAMRKSGRPIDLTQAQFDAIQARKPAAMARIASYLKDRLGSADPAVMHAFDLLPREYYHYNYADHRAMSGEAYEADPKPWALGYGSALSDYLGQAYMSQICKPTAHDVTLEIGTGSGFQSSLLSRIVKRSYSIEIIEPLGHAVAKLWAPLGFDNIESRVGDGYFGWPEVKEGFDIIIVTCAAQYTPPDLFKQLKPGGRMIIPIGQPFKRGQVLYVYTKDAEGKVHSKRDVGVFFIPMTGAMMNRPKPADTSTPKPDPVAATEAAPAATPAVDAPK